MKIVKCSRCGKYIHKASVCLYCGNAFGFEEFDETSIHEKAVFECAHIDALIEEKKYSEAIDLSYAIHEWMPNLAEVFWLRLLAKNSCSSDAELIRKGFDVEDADLCNALKFSAGREHDAYVELQKTVSEIRQVLLREIPIHENKCKSQTGVLEIGKDFLAEIGQKKERLFSMWSELEKTEHSLSTIEADCCLVAREHQNSLAQAAQTASLLKMEIYRKNGCSSKDLQSYRIKLETALRLSETAKEAIENMKKQHPWVKAFFESVSVRDEQVKSIRAEISSLADYEKTVQKVLNEIDQIDNRHKNALRAAYKYDFSDVAALLGKNEFERVLHRAGIHTNFASGSLLNDGIAPTNN